MGNSWLKAGARSLLAGAGLFVVGTVGCTGPEKAIDSRPINSSNTGKGFGATPGSIPGTAGAGLASSQPPLQPSIAGARSPMQTTGITNPSPRGIQPAGISTPTNPTLTQPTYNSQPSGGIPTAGYQSQRSPALGATLPSGAGAAHSPTPLPLNTSTTASTPSWSPTPIASSTQSSPAIQPTRAAIQPPPPMGADDGALTLPAPTVAAPKPAGTNSIYVNDVPPLPASVSSPTIVPVQTPTPAVNGRVNYQ